MADDLIKTGGIATVFGGSGFLGRHVVRALAQAGWRVRVAARRPDLAFFLQPLGRVGQVQSVQANVRVPASIAAAIRGADAVINLTGVLTESGAQTFQAVHVDGARAIAQAASAAGVSRVVHISALGADPASASAYARSKGEGEAAVLDASPGATILRPSIVFGPEDAFFNRFAAIARIAPALPLFGGGETRLQPVFAGDVAQCVARALDGAATPGAAYELGGADIRTFRELMQFILDTTGRKRLLVPIPFGLGRVMAGATEIANSLGLGLFPPELLFTRDQLELLRVDNVVSETARTAGRTLEAFGVTPSAFESIVPAYLQRFRSTGQFARRETA
jgi:NADH dehydrogenase